MNLRLSRLWRGGDRHGNQRPERQRRRAAPLRLEALEDRIVPSTIEVMNLNASGSGSLAAAVSSAHSNDTIVFAPGLSGTITVNTPLAFQAGVTNVSINGPAGGGIAVSGGGVSEVFAIAAGESVTLANLEIIGGASAFGGAIANAGTLTINNCLIDKNTATASALGLLGISGGGGGIVNQSTGVLTINNSAIVNNTVQNGAVNAGTISGGGVENLGGTAKLTNCTVADNRIQSSVNALTESGAGLENSNNGTMTLVNCTVVGNTITALVTVAGTGGGIDNQNGSTLNLVNTIVDNPNGASTGTDVNGSIATAVDSLFSSSTGNQILNTLLGGSLLGDVFNNNLLGSGLLGNLGLNNGGTTPTIPLLGNVLTNPAIGSGLNPSQLTSTLSTLLNNLGVSLPTVDQNSVDRGLSYLDMGAFQTLLPTVTTLTGNLQNGLANLTATVTGPNGPINGVVQFLDNGVLLGTANLVNGVATLLTNLLSSGQNVLTAVFQGVSGIPNLGGSTSPPVTMNGGSSGGGGGGGSGGSGGGNSNTHTPVGPLTLFALGFGPGGAIDFFEVDTTGQVFVQGFSFTGPQGTPVFIASQLQIPTGLAAVVDNTVAALLSTDGGQLDLIDIGLINPMSFFDPFVFNAVLGAFGL
jgi:hypothetical protein